MNARSEGERTRLREQIARLRSLIDGLEITLRSDVPALESAQAVADTSIRLATTTARYDAFQLAHADRDAQK